MVCAIISPGTSAVNAAAAPAKAASLLPNSTTGRPKSAATRTKGSTKSDPGTSDTGRRAKRDNQTIGLPSATTISWAA